MKIKKTTKYILNEDEARIIKACLNYCWHRLAKHNKKDIGLNIDQVEKLRIEFLDYKKIDEAKNKIVDNEQEK